MARKNRRRSSDRAHFWRVGLKVGFLLALLGLAGFYGYQVGRQLIQDELAAAHQELEWVTDEAAGNREKLAAIDTELAQARDAAADYRKRYEAVAPNEEVAALVEAMRAKLATGLEPQRLALAIAAAAPPRNCARADTKRFMVRTPRYDGPNTWVRFNETVTVTADGSGGRGGTEEWFDPNMPVTVNFVVIGGKESKVSGKLPLQHTQVIKNVEYRFTVAPGPRGFVEVTGDHCEWQK